MIGKRNVAQKFPGVVDVKGRPPAVPALHPQQPIYRAPGSRFLRRAIARLRLVQTNQHHRGVIDIRVKFVRKFKVPTGWFQVRPLHRPIAFATALLS